MLYDATSRTDGPLPDVRSMGREQAILLDRSIEWVDWTSLPAGVERWEIEAPSGRLAGLRAGPMTGERVILMPGVTGSKEDFSLMLPLFAQAGYLAEAFDLAGHYESIDAGPELLDPPRHRYDHELFVDDLLAVLGTGSGPVHLLGYSFGATIAQLAMARHPDRFASLTLLSAPPLAGQTFRGAKSVIGPISHLIPGRQGAALMLWGIARNFNRTPAHRYEFVMSRMPRLRRQAVDDVIGLMRRTPDVSAQIRSIDVPKLVAYGAHDLWPVSAHEALAARLGAAVTRYNAGHSPCEETPHQLTRDMIRLFGRVQAEE